MKLSAFVDAKVESATLEGDTIYFLHLSLKLNDETMASPDGGIKAAVRVTESQFAEIESGSEILFEEVARV